MNPFEGMSDKDIADYVREIGNMALTEESDPDLEPCYMGVVNLILEAEKRGGLDLKITVKGEEESIWNITVKKRET